VNQRVGTATILISDVVASTEISVALGDSTADDLRRRHDALLSGVIERFDGTVVKSLGDGLMASFTGAASAVAAAVEMQRENDRLSRRSPDQERLSIRIGLSAGDVIWEGGDCHGTPVVTAARLCNAASGGEVLCDELVRGLARGRKDLTFSSVGPLDLKGLPEAVPGFRIPWMRSSSEIAPLPGALRALPGELPYAGRTGEQTRLTELWKAAQSEGASVVLIVGEPGIGKSRLVSEVARRAQSEGALVLLGRCDEQVPAPHAPWIEALKTLVAHADHELLIEHVHRHGGALSRLVPELLDKVPDVPAAANDDPDTERLLLFDAVTDLVASVSVQTPVILVLEDAHWADSGSVNLLRHFVAHVDVDAPILVAVTFRDTDIDRSHAFSGALGDLHRSARTERLVLHGLDESGILALLEGTAGHELDRDEDARFLQRLVAETEGNPFFISEILRHMVESGLLVEEGGRWVGTVSVEEGGIPEGVRDVVGQRLSRFSPEINDLLRTAAVMGREFDLAPLAQIVERSEDDVVDDLDAAIGARLVNEVEDTIGRLSFEHALVRQTLLEELSTNKRIRMHRKIAEALDERGGTPIDVLAHHYCEAALAGVAERAVETARAAAEIAAHAFAWDESIRLLERALEALDAFADPDRGLECDVRCELAFSQHFSGDSPTARRTALEAVQIAREIDDPVRLGDAGRSYQGELGMWTRPGDEIGIGVLREALDAIPNDEIGPRARVSAALAHGLILAPGAGGLVAADEAVAAAELAGDPIALQQALVAQSWCARGSLPAADRIKAAERVIAVARDNQSRTTELAGTYLLLNAMLSIADIEGAETLAATVSFRGALEGWPVAILRSARAYAEGRYEEAERLSQVAYDLGESLGDTNEAVRSGPAFLAAVECGDLETARIWIARNLKTAVGGAFPSSAVLAASESPTLAAELLGRWMSEVRPLVANMLGQIATTWAARTAFLIGEFAGTEELEAYLDTFAGEFVGNDTTLMGSADWFRGLLAAVADRLDEAVDLVSAGHDMHVELGFHARSAESGHDLGLILLRRDGPGDRERGVNLLVEASDLAEQLGMKPVVDSARAALEQSPDLT